MENYLIDFIDTLDQSLKNFHRMVRPDSGFSTLTISQLHYIDAIASLGEPTISEIAKALKITKASVTGGINKLIKLGFAQKTRSNDDRRVYYIRLTPAAQDLVEARFRVLQEYGQLVQSALTEEETRQFKAAIVKITRLFKDREVIANQISDQPGGEKQG